MLQKRYFEDDKVVWLLHRIIKSYLKNVIYPNLCVESSFQRLGILEYACGLNLSPALILNQNPIFEMASIVFSNVDSKRA
jgi:hypothetical protein